jgi:hypothetical protein
MKFKSLPSLRLLIFSFFVFPTFITTAFAQSIEPDEQIIREMTAYAARIQDAAQMVRPRIFNKSNRA